MLGCEAVRDALAAYQDDELEARDQAEIAAHLEQCETCRQHAQAQAALCRRLRGLKRRPAEVALPPHIWANATRAWKCQDAARSRSVRLRLALVGVCLLLITFGTVWAGLAAPRDFPVTAAMNDFRYALQHTVMPAYPTTDADRAAKWLRAQLKSDVPPLNLSLSRAQLIGADVLQTPSLRLGRLLYRSQGRLLAIYIAPRGIQFPRLRTVVMEGREFSIMDNARDIGFYGWAQDFLGYGLLTPQPMSAGADSALDARRVSEPPGR